MVLITEGLAPELRSAESTKAVASTTSTGGVTDAVATPVVASC